MCRLDIIAAITIIITVIRIAGKEKCQCSVYKMIDHIKQNMCTPAISQKKV